MRSFAAKAVIAAVLVTTSITGAFAAGPLYPAQPQPVQTQPVKKVAMAPETIKGPVYRPRMTHIMSEINTANRRMATDHRHGYLNVAEYRRLENQSDAIRNSAFHVAKQHDGALPEASYQNLLERIALLNQSIHTYATNRA